MKLYNIIDEQGRFCGFKIDTTQDGEQRDSHTYSYMQQRKLYQEMGDEMGLDRVVRREVAALQIKDMRQHHESAVVHNVVPPTTPLRVYVADKYCRPGSILPALFRYRLERGLVQ